MIKSKERIAEFGEVFTSEREVNAMLDLVLDETQRIDSRFLEPACGDGNFLSEILMRKLTVVAKVYRSSNFDFEVAAFQAVSSVYGIDILEDNVIACRKRLFAIASNFYERTQRKNISSQFSEALQYVIQKNIIHGNALTLMDAEGKRPIVFSEWNIVHGRKVKRIDYTYENLLAYQPFDEQSLFSDLGTEAFLPPPIKSHDLVHYLEVNNE
jgi:hypothetical protein